MTPRTPREYLSKRPPNSVKMTVQATSQQGLFEEANQHAIAFFGPDTAYELVWYDVEPAEPIMDFGTGRKTISLWKAEVWIRTH